MPDARVQAMREVKAEEKQEAAELQKRHDEFGQRVQEIQEQYHCSYDEAVFKATKEKQGSAPFKPKGSK